MKCNQVVYVVLLDTSTVTIISALVRAVHEPGRDFIAATSYHHLFLVEDLHIPQCRKTTELQKLPEQRQW